LPGFFGDITNLDGFSSRGLIMQANLENPGPTLEQVAGLPPGSAFPIGTTTVTYTSTDVAGNVTTCSFDIVVNEFPNAVTQLNCNDQVQISLDENCQAVIGADDILEGGPYGCYDDYIVMVLDATQAPLPSGNVVDGSFIGSTWTVKVVDPETGNSCWGAITVEDKLAPTIECQDATINCNAEIQFGVPISQTAKLNSGPQPTFDNTSMEFEFPFAGAPANATVTDVNVALQINHTWVSDMTVSVISPDNQQVVLFSAACGTADNVDATFDDAGDPFACSGGTPAIAGVLQPEDYPTQQLATFNGINPNGTWKIRVVDAFGADPVNIVNMQLQISYEGSWEAPVAADNCGIASVDFVESEAEGDCGGPASVITRTWTVTDLSGNTASCVQTITKVRNTLEDVEFPADVTVSCDDYAANPSIIDATADGAGVPTIGGIPVEIGDLCDITCSLSDEVTIPVCDGTFKVRRKWLCIDWCA
ncbi:MAG: HYR domain-containing protein, partial [Bacteroidetes bacterium]